jgi:two-component system response regulator FixJ
MNGLELQEELIARRIGLPVVFVTGYGDVPTTARALKMGAVDFLEKPFQDDMILEAIQRAIERDAMGREQRASQAENEERLSRLSARERQVLDLVLAGCPNKAVATKLGVTQRTVEVHRARIMRKTQTRSLPELVRLVERSQACNKDC